MKTIEERADDYVGHPFDIDEDITHTFRRLAYKIGSIEQNKIDIEKACEYLRSRYMWTDAGLDVFRDVMELK